MAVIILFSYYCCERQRLQIFNDTSGLNRDSEAFHVGGLNDPQIRYSAISHYSEAYSPSCTLLRGFC